MDALEETGAFIKTMGELVATALAQQEQVLSQTRRRVQADEGRLIFVHLQHQVAQLLLLRDSLTFCTEELAQSETTGFRALAARGIGIRAVAPHGTPIHAIHGDDGKQQENLEASSTRPP